MRVPPPLDEMLEAECMLGDGGEPAGVVAQRVPVAAVEPVSLPVYRRVVAAVVAAPRPALHLRERPRDTGRALALEPVDVDRGPTGEAHRDRLLLGAEDVDRERPALQRVVRPRAAGDAC